MTFTEEKITIHFFSEQTLANVAEELQQQQREINAVLEQKTLPIF